jgi:transcriptional regulator with XRE-family HTH domain
LLARLQKATAERGKKSELARYMGEPPQRINDWLSGSRVPSGEVTLHLLDWVTAEEAKQKSPGSVQPPPERMTQRKTSDHEKQSSGQTRRYQKKQRRTIH